MTVKIAVKNHIAEYCRGKYSDGSTPVRFPHKTEVYHTIWNLLEKRPVSASPDEGNLEIFLPCSKMKALDTSLPADEAARYFVKDPSVYNYLTLRSASIIEKKIESFMFAEMHLLLLSNRQLYGVNYIDTVYEFMLRYQIDSVTPDMYIKDFYRWRNRLHRRNVRRNYRKIGD